MKYRKILRSFLLPLNPKQEETCISYLKEFLLNNVSNEFEDQTLWINSQNSTWKEDNRPTSMYRELIENLIKSGDACNDLLGKKYFEIHTMLVSIQLINHDFAKSFLSHLLLIYRLADEERMSSAQIASILNVMNPKVGFSRRSVEAVLGKLGIAPKIGVPEIRSLIELDKETEVFSFGDSDLSGCIDIVSDLGANLGFTDNLKKDLNTLIPSDNIGKFTPYLQILHYQCSILEYFDHLTKDFYEFSPRGAAAKELFESYPSSIVNANNPFLNNAKSVAQANLPWALGKKNKELPGATALYNILQGLDTLGFSARHELASWIRRLLQRAMVLVEPLKNPISVDVTKEQMSELLDSIVVANTNTKGIIEQRIVDAVTMIMHPCSGGWKPRGIGDSVNASNLSRKKLGDCDYQKIEDKIVYAYEAHGGSLTKTYLDEHLKNLPKVAKPRIEEWALFSSPSDWEVIIVFVAHSFETDLPNDMEIDDVRFSFRFEPYPKFVQSVDSEDLIDSFHKYFVSPLAENRTPAFVRRQLTEIID